MNIHSIPLWTIIASVVGGTLAALMFAYIVFKTHKFLKTQRQRPLLPLHADTLQPSFSPPISVRKFENRKLPAGIDLALYASLNILSHMDRVPLPPDCYIPPRPERQWSPLPPTTPPVAIRSYIPPPPKFTEVEGPSHAVAGPYTERNMISPAVTRRYRFEKTAPLMVMAACNMPPPRYSFPREEVTPGMHIVDPQSFIVPKSIMRYKGPLVVMNQEQQEEECISREQTDPACDSSNSDSLISATDAIVKDYMPQAIKDELVPSMEVGLQTSDTRSSLPCRGHDSLTDHTQRLKLVVTIPTICVNPPASCDPIPLNEPAVQISPDVSRCNLPLSDSPAIPQTKRHRRQGALFKHPLTLSEVPHRRPLPPVPCVNQTSGCPQDRPPLFAPIHKISDHAQRLRVARAKFERAAGRPFDDPEFKGLTHRIDGRLCARPYARNEAFRERVEKWLKAQQMVEMDMSIPPTPVLSSPSDSDDSASVYSIPVTPSSPFHNHDRESGEVEIERNEPLLSHPTAPEVPNATNISEQRDQESSEEPVPPIIPEIVLDDSNISQPVSAPIDIDPTTKDPIKTHRSQGSGSSISSGSSSSSSSSTRSSQSDRSIRRVRAIDFEGLRQTFNECNLLLDT